MAVISSGSIYPHIQAEKGIVREIVSKALELGYTATVDNGDGEERAPQSAGAITELATGVDEATLWLRRDGTCAFILFVFGNSPEEVVCDYTDCADIRAVLGKYAE